MLTIICPHYHALHFDCEKLTFSRVNYLKFGMCCLQGQIQLPPLQPLTGILHNYLTGDDYPSREFCNNIWQYNAVFAMYHKWLLTICDECFDTLKSSKMQS